MGTEANNSLSIFAQRLVSLGYLTSTQAEEAAKRAEQDKKSLINHLHETQILDSKKLAEVASKTYGIPLYDLRVHNPSFIPQEFLELDIVVNKEALPILKRPDKLVVAVADADLPSLREISFVTGLKTEFVIVDGAYLRLKIDELTAPLEETEEVNFEEFEINAYNDEKEDDSTLSFGIDDTPVVRFVNKVLMDAIRSKSSDIHFEPYEKLYRVRYRQDGILYEVATPPFKLVNSIVARLKVMANLDISERRVPQDGRFKLTLGKDRAIDFRISTLPTLHGEKVVMRILDPSATQLDIATLGFEPRQQEDYLKAINMSQGIILVTGPTGSGKTVSLYTALRILNRPEKNISTIEDPVEIYMQGINQVQVNLKSGMTFSKALRAFLRQDPDIMMVGEIRDLETAEIAVKAAQTGHLVLSTLHTNSAPETLDRLRNIGIQTFNLASSVLLVMAQRLARRLCQNCKKLEKINEVMLKGAGFNPEECVDIQFYGPGNCDACTRGYKGRVGIYEVMPISVDMQRIIINEGNTLDLREQMIKEGIKTLAQSGMDKVRQGLTSFEEINRVCSR